MYGAKIVTIRTRLGLSQKDMALMLNVSPAALCKVEKGLNSPGATINRNLAAKCNVNLNWFFADMGDMFIANNTMKKD